MRPKTNTCKRSRRLANFIVIIQLLSLSSPLLPFVSCFTANLPRPWISEKSLSQKQLKLLLRQTELADEVITSSSSSSDDVLESDLDESESEGENNDFVANKHGDDDIKKCPLPQNSTASLSLSSYSPILKENSLKYYGNEMSQQQVKGSIHKIAKGSSSTIDTRKSHLSAATKESSVAPTVGWYLRQLIYACRPSKLLPVVLFHILGVHLVLKSTNYQSGGLTALGSNISILSKSLFHPQLLLVLAAILGITSSSVIINDYYNTKFHTDSPRSDGMKSFVSSNIPFSVTKTFLNYVYGSLVIALAFVPGAVTKLSIAFALTITYYYTVHLKPITWIKNVVCASLIAVAPLSSGSATISINNGKGALDSSVIDVFTSNQLWSLVGLLLFAFVGRELMIDISGISSDIQNNILTVPVEYGRKYASALSLVCTGLGCMFAIFNSIKTNKDLISSRVTLALACAASLFTVRSSYHIFRTEGHDGNVVRRAIDEGKYTFFLLFASYL